VKRTAILVKNYICCALVTFRSPFQIVAVRLHLPTLHITLCNIYLPSGAPVRWTGLSQLLPLYSLFGNVHANHILRAENVTDDRGTLFCDMCRFRLNRLQHTCRYISLPEVVSPSALVFTICSPGVAVRSDWSVLPDLDGGDHNPDNLHIDYSIPNLVEPPKRNTRHADWDALGPGLYGGVFHELFTPRFDARCLLVVHLARCTRVSLWTL
jgi:hypothetical protein